MHVKAKKIAFGGVLLAVTVLCMLLGSIIESNTLFLLAAASFFVGIMLREFGVKTGAAFYLAGVLLGLITAPNKFYVISYAAMGLYILLIEIGWRKLGKLSWNGNRRAVFWGMKFFFFNLIYIPGIVLFEKLLFTRNLSGWMFAGVLAAGQVGLFLYDRAYEYVQGNIWSKIRGKIF